MDAFALGPQLEEINFTEAVYTLMECIWDCISHSGPSPGNAGSQVQTARGQGRRLHRVHLLLSAKRSRRTRVVILEKRKELKQPFIALVEMFVRGCVIDILPQGARNALVYQNNTKIVGDNPVKGVDIYIYRKL